mmetsp:Transcript_2857/g.4156  ORF Transcript_2857/g.4156 Transcript_2857/m.4156 type:complete len:208 (-) Transcript_2857:138-761(-)
MMPETQHRHYTLTNMYHSLSFLVESSSNANDTPFIQYRFRVGGGPSEKTWPKWLPQALHRTSRHPKSPIRYTGWIVRSTAPGSASQNEGHPVPELNFVDEENSGCPQPVQTYLPLLFSCKSGDVKALSVPRSIMTANSSFVSSFFHSSFDFFTFRSFRNGTWRCTSHKSAKGQTKPKTSLTEMGPSAASTAIFRFFRICNPNLGLKF